MSFVDIAPAEPAPEPFIVGAPFDSDPAADVVLRSSDNFEFRARKAILSLTSPGFNDLIGTLRSKSTVEIDTSTPHEASLPCIQLSETGPVVDILLRQCYPLAPPLIVDDLDTFFAVRLASYKYDMTFIRTNMDKHMKESHTNDARYNVLWYRIACEQHMAAQARQCAWDCLRLPLATILNQWQPVPSSDKALSNLVDYHHTVSLRIGEYLGNFKNIRILISNMRCTGNNSKAASCNVYFSDLGGSSSGPTWWGDQLLSELQRIYKEGPVTGRVLNLPRVTPLPLSKRIGYTSVTATHHSEQLSANLGVNLPPEQILRGLCSTCKISVLKNWAVFITELNKNIEEEAKKVCLNPTSQIQLTELWER